MQIAVFSLDLAATQANFFISAKSLRAAPGGLHAICIGHALLIASSKVSADIVVATPRETFKIEIAIVFVKLLPLKAEIRMNTFGV